VQFTERGLAALLASPHWKNLRSLTISVDAIGDAFAHYALNLTSLSLRVARFDDADAATLMKTPALRALKSLSIDQLGAKRLELGDVGVRHMLTAAPKLAFFTNVTLAKETEILIATAELRADQNE